MIVINEEKEEKEEPTWEEVLQDNRDEAAELAEADDFKENQSSGKE